MENKVNKIDSIKKERKGIINEYPAKPLSSTIVDNVTSTYTNEQKVIVKEIIEETPDTKSFLLAPNTSKGTNELKTFTPGMYLSVKVKIGSEYTTRAYTISSSPALVNKNIYKITVKRLENGKVSNYLLDNLHIGSELIVSYPTGNFGFNKVRDEKNVIAIAGGSGITPFMSLAEAIIDGYEDCNLTVFYSVRTYEDIIFRKRIEEINKRSKKVKFVVTLTRDEKKDYLNGHISKEMLEPYIKEFNTILMCGPKALYKSMNEILSEFNIPKKSVHFENFFMEYNPQEVVTYDLKVILKNDFILAKCSSDETLLVAMEKAGINAPSLCRVGVCGYCRSILLEGKIKMIGNNLKKAEAENDYIHPCITYPESDIVLRLDI
ncbi:MAG: iron-sulfur cluster-binding domain-containing protein [Ruminococcus sp.]|nr:iron-sulfur cluster-binding domain-containing protein [Ruminococcus sp.]